MKGTETMLSETDRKQFAGNEDGEEESPKINGFKVENVDEEEEKEKDYESSDGSSEAAFGKFTLTVIRETEEPEDDTHKNIFRDNSSSLALFQKDDIATPNERSLALLRKS